MKKILSVILACLMAASAISFAASAQDGSGKKDVGEHEHQIMKMANAACHYEECTICFELFNVGDHTFVDGKCSVCGHYDPTPTIKGEGEHEHIIIKTADESSHFDECMVCLERFGVAKHEMENGVCTVCRYPNMEPDSEHNHVLMKMANMNSHYEECQVCFELFGVGDHTFANGKCTVCGHPELVNPFVDVAYDAWYAEDVLAAVSTGLVNGKGNGEFKPDDFLTYAEAVKLAACMNQLYTKGSVTLTNGEPWYQTYVDFCNENRIIRSDYNWSEYTTRVGYMYIFANALPEEAYEEINTIEDDAIPDVPSSAPFADPVYKLYRAGIVTGVDQAHNCNPMANIKRSEVAVIVARMMDPSKRKRFDMKSVYGSTDIGTADRDINYGNNSIEVTMPDGSQMTDKGAADDVDIGKGNESIIVGGTDIDNFGIISGDVTINETPTQTMYASVTVVKQPKDYFSDSYGIKTELEVEVKGGTAPYTYEWYYNGYRNQKTKIENGDYVKDATSEALVLSVEKENILLGVGIFCKVTDANGITATSDTVKVYGPFSMVLELSETVTVGNEYTLVGRVSDGVLTKGEKISVERNGKIIAMGTVKDIQMFSKSLDEAIKGDRPGVVFTITDGVRPVSGDIVIKYKDTHKIDTSDIVN